MPTKEQQLAARACRLLGESQVLARAAKEREAEAKALIEELLPPGEKGELASASYGTISRTYQERLGIDASAEDTLRDVLGERFPDYVTRTVTLKPTKKLKELLVDADAPLGLAARPHVAVKRAPVVKFVPAPGVTFLPELFATAQS